MLKRYVNNVNTSPSENTESWRNFEGPRRLKRRSQKREGKGLIIQNKTNSVR